MKCANCGESHAQSDCARLHYLPKAELVLAAIALLEIESANILDPDSKNTAQTMATFLTLREATAGYTGVSHSVDIDKIAEETKRLKVGNCQDLACLAFQMLARHNVKPLSLLLFDFKDMDHVVVALGPCNPGRGNPLDSPDLVICDPWANLCRIGDEYAEAFRGTMSYWESHLRITIARLGDPVKPTHFANILMLTRPHLMFSSR